MEDLIQIIVNNGLGVSSFIVMVFFMYSSLKQTNETLNSIKDTLVLIQTNLIKLSERVSDIEDKLKGE